MLNILSESAGTKKGNNPPGTWPLAWLPLGGGASVQLLSHFAFSLTLFTQASQRNPDAAPIPLRIRSASFEGLAV